MATQRGIQARYRRAQRGAVLIISLMVLLVMTILGISAMNSTTLQETFSANRQYKAISFQAAESVAKRVWRVPTLGASIAGATTTTVAPGDADNFNSTTQMSVTASASVSYCGELVGSQNTEMNADETAVTVGEHIFDVTGNATVGAANAVSRHTAGASVRGPSAGSAQINCTL